MSFTNFRSNGNYGEYLYGSPSILPFGRHYMDDVQSAGTSDPNLIQETIIPSGSGLYNSLTNTIQKRRFLQSFSNKGEYSGSGSYNQNALDNGQTMYVILNSYTRTMNSLKMHKLVASITVIIKIDENLNGTASKIYVGDYTLKTTIAGTIGNNNVVPGSYPTMVTPVWYTSEHNSPDISTYIPDPSFSPGGFQVLIDGNSCLAFYISPSVSINYSIDVLLDVEVISMECN